MFRRNFPVYFSYFEACGDYELENSSPVNEECELATRECSTNCTCNTHTIDMGCSSPDSKVDKWTILSIVLGVIALVAIACIVAACILFPIVKKRYIRKVN